MSDFSDWTQSELAERPSVASIEATGSLLVKANNPFSRNYDALAQGTSGQVLLSEGVGTVPVWSSDSDDWDTAYSHSQNNSQAHTDYLINNGNDETSGTFTAAAFVTTGDITINSDSSLLKLGAEQDYTIGWDSSNAVHTITAGTFAFLGGRMGVGTAAAAATLSIRHFDSDLPAYSVNLITNGDFASDLSDWTIGDGGAEWVWDTGKARHVTGNASTFYQNVVTSNAGVYLVTFTISGRTAGNIRITFGSSVGDYALNTNVTHVLSFKAIGTSSALTFTPASTFNGSIDDVSVQLLTGTTPLLTLNDNSDVVRMEMRTVGNNTFIGFNSGSYNISGIANVGLGLYALQRNVSGNFNVAIGSYALENNLSGTYNMAIGADTLKNNVTGNSNIAVGRIALKNNTTGSQNIVIGQASGLDITIGDWNTIVGYNTGLGIITGDRNIIIGSNVSGLAANLQKHIIFADGYGNQRIIVDGSGHVHIPTDDTELQFGAAKDYSIQWDGDDAVHTIIAGSYKFTGGSLIVGGGTDNIEFEADGMLVMNGAATVWDDIRVSALSTKLGAIKQPTFSQFADDGAGSTGVYTYMFADNAEEQVFFSVLIPHGYKLGSDLQPHVHWSPQTTDIGQIDWFLEYTIANLDSTFGTTTTITLSDNGDGTINKHQKAETDTIDGSNLTLASKLICRLYRDGGQGNDDFVGDAALLEFDIHFEQDTIGSHEGYIK